MEKCIKPNAFGNALGSSLAQEIVSGKSNDSTKSFSEQIQENRERNTPSWMKTWNGDSSPNSSIQTVGDMSGDRGSYNPYSEDVPLHGPNAGNNDTPPVIRIDGQIPIQGGFLPSNRSADFFPQYLRDSFPNGTPMYGMVDGKAIDCWGTNTGCYMPTSATSALVGNASNAARYEMETVGDFYKPQVGFFQQRYAEAVDGINNGDWVDKAVYTVLGTGLLIPNLVESVATGLYNAPNQFLKAGNYFYNALNTDDTDQRVMNSLAGVRDASFGFLGVAGAYSVVKPPVSSAASLPLVRMQTQAELAEIRSTYQTAESMANGNLQYPQVTIVDVNGVTRTVAPTSNFGGIHGLGVESGKDAIQAGLEIWENGLPGKGTNFNIAEHVYAAQGTPAAANSGFRGTTQLPGLAARFALNNSEQGLLIEIRGVPSFDAQIVLENAGKRQFLDAMEVENAIHAQQSSQYIKSIRTVYGTPEKPIYGPYIPKPNQ